MLIVVLQGTFQQITDFILSSPKRIVDTTRKTMYISYRTLRTGGLRNDGLVLLTLLIHEDITVLKNACGHDRSSIFFHSSSLETNELSRVDIL